MNSGAGRIALLRMRPMSLFEADRSSGDISLHSVITEGLNKPSLTGEVSLLSIADSLIPFLLCICIMTQRKGNSIDRFSILTGYHSAANSSIIPSMLLPASSCSFM